jgi:hypothetical protein
MPGLVPGIHVFLLRQRCKGVDGRDKPGHDEFCRLEHDRLMLNHASRHPEAPLQSNGLEG